MKTIENTKVHTIHKTADKTLTMEQENELLKQRVEELQAKVNHYEELFRLNQHQKYWFFQRANQFRSNKLIQRSRKGVNQEKRRT